MPRRRVWCPSHTSTKVLILIEMRYFIFWLHFLALVPFLSLCNIQLALSLPLSNSPRHLCHHEDSTALLRFVRDLVIDSSASENCADLQTARPKTTSWNRNVDCCSWDGVSCSPLSGHVIELDLSCSRIRGTIDSNSTLFQLQRLQNLNLAFNNFNNSGISPKFGQFPHLKYLNLSSAFFTGKVPVEIARLSGLISLHISSDNTLEMPDLGLITENMTELTELLLEDVSVNSVMPRSLVNLSSLKSLTLSGCGLRGNFLADVLHLPHLRNLVIEDDGLHANFSGFSWTSPLEELTLSSTHFTGKLSEPVGPVRYLRKLHLPNCNFYGVVPSWVWNVTQEIDLSYNQFSGELPYLLNTSILSGITDIDLSQNMLSGKIPFWIFTLPSLEKVDFSDNQFSGQLVIDNYSNISRSLRSLDLSANMVHGSIPTSISALESLEILSLSSNRINGTIDFSMFHRLKSLSVLVLSDNDLSLSFDNIETTIVRPQFTVLGLSSCNLGKFPDFLIDQESLSVLELSNNRIHGQVPHWLLVKNTLFELDISYNYLTGGLEHVPWNDLDYIDLSSNMFSGPLPQLPPSIQLYLVSSNYFTGGIPSTVCHLTSLLIFDLSNNSLTGRIPQCLGNLSDRLAVLNLKLNNFHGTLPQDFGKFRYLKNLDVNGNQLEGPVPTSLSNCSSLQVLDLGNNHFSGKFPHWLGTLPDLEVLVLRSNRFEGSETGLDYGQTLFPKLRIIDIANNRFSGNIPHKLIKSLKAMTNKEEKEKLQYTSEILGNYSNYMYSIALTFKGTDHELDRVLSVATAIDVSSNRFDGDIPGEIGDLVSLRWLNLSYNYFGGTIPPSLGNLTLLESLDVSSNELVGQIPKELVSLEYLEFFNASRNQLVGPIPAGNQFDTFGNESYLENPSLCGTPLSKNCGDDDHDHDAAAEPTSMEYRDSQDISVWDIVLLGYGCGMVLGLSVGFSVFWGRTPSLHAFKIDPSG